MENDNFIYIFIIIIVIYIYNIIIYTLFWPNVHRFGLKINITNSLKLRKPPKINKNNGFGMSAFMSAVGF